MIKCAWLREGPGGELCVSLDALLCPVDQALAAYLMGGVNELTADRDKDEGGRENPDGKKRKGLDHGIYPPVNQFNGRQTLPLSVRTGPRLRSSCEA